jgi:acetyl coenzyme A synthetase (ADP forming)-like protein
VENRAVATHTHPEYETDVLLRDGSTVHMRPVRPEDRETVEALYRRLSERSLYMRFHRPTRQPPDEELRLVLEGATDDSFALVATLGEPPDQRVIALGRYDRSPERPDHADIAFTVEDSHQGRGIASQLLDHLAVAARDHEIAVFEADVMGENQAMMDVFRDSGYPLASGLKYGTFHVAFPITDTHEAEHRAAEREAEAAANSIKAFFTPSSVAVIGASRDRGTFGAEIFHNIIEAEYSGRLFAVNRTADEVEGHKAFASVLDIPDEVDLAVIVVPAPAVLDVVQECADKGVRGLVIISAGFKESGEGGAALQQEIVARARSYGMRIIGPNCMGVVNANPGVSLNATFGPIFPPFGNVALLSQSGALGLALLDYSRNLNIGLSTFVSIGNKADVSSNDLIQYWEQDPDTNVILLYLESFGNPRKFSRLAQRIAPKKPIVAVKSGRTRAGSRAASSHTGALASLDIAVDALFQQAGVIRVDTLEELFDVASLLAHQPIPAGNRVAILTNAGGPGILCADACESYGLQVSQPGEATHKRLASILPAEAGLSNPIDMVGSAAAEEYGRTLRVLMEDDSFDAVIVIFIPPLATQTEDVAASIRDVAADYSGQKTMLACFMSTRGAPPELVTGDSALPSYIFPEAAALALARITEYGSWRGRPRGAVPEFDVDRDTARRVVDSALADGTAEGVWLSPPQCANVLRAYDIRSTRMGLAKTAEEAARVAAKISFPVAVKLASKTVTHKSDIGGVILNVGSPDEVKQAFEKIRQRLVELDRKDEMDGVLIQEMAPLGIEAIVGVTHDPLFGPLIMFGLGGTLVELLKDVSFRIHPLKDIDAREMVRSIKGYPLLEGWRGAPAGDVAALEDVLLRISCLVEDLPEIAEMDLNPIKVLPPGEGCITVDARILLRQPEQRRRQRHV